jgi:hypothetical protein
MIIRLGVTAMLEMLKSKANASKWRKVMLKVFRAIATQYKDDEEFQTVAQAWVLPLK